MIAEHVRLENKRKTEEEQKAKEDAERQKAIQETVKRLQAKIAGNSVPTSEPNEAAVRNRKRSISDSVTVEPKRKKPEPPAPSSPKPPSIQKPKDLRELVLRKDKNWISKLINQRTDSAANRDLMNQLVKQYRASQAEKLNSERFTSKVSENLDELSVCEVDLKDLPEDFVSKINNLVAAEAESDDDEIQEVPVPPKPPPLVVTIDGDDASPEQNQTKSQNDKVLSDQNEQQPLPDQQAAETQPLVHDETDDQPPLEAKPVLEPMSCRDVNNQLKYRLLEEFNNERIKLENERKQLQVEMETKQKEIEILNQKTRDVIKSLLS